MRRKSKVEKISIHVSIPKELFEESELYIENFSAYFTACLKNKIDSIRKHQMKVEETDIIQTNRTYNSNYSTPHDVLTLEEERYMMKYHPDFICSDSEFDSYSAYAKACKKIIKEDRERGKI